MHDGHWPRDAPLFWYILHVPNSRITVVCPCFNDGLTIVETVDSIRELEPIEVLIVDDGSTDQLTIDVLAELEQRDHVTLVRHHVNRGVPAGINSGLSHATTAFVFFIGADDLIEPGALAALADALELDEGALVAWGHYEFFGARSGQRTTPPWDPWRLLHNNYWTGVAMVRRERLLALGGASERSAYEDWDMWMSVAESRGHGIVIDVPMFRYRIHATSVRRCATAKDQFPAEYAAMVAGHASLFARRSELAQTSTMGRVARSRERIMLALKRRLPRSVRRLIYGSAAWLETRHFAPRTHV